VTARAYSQQEREDALALCADMPLGQAARQTGIPKSTLGTWCRRAGVRTFAVQQTREANEAREVGLEERRQNIAETLYAEVERSLAGLDGPVPVYAFTRDGLGTGTAPQPNPKDRQARVVAVAVLLDKALLLTGQATERHDLGDGIDLEAELQEARAEKLELERLRALVGEDDDGPADKLRAV